jgi:hypothetical protein
MATRERGSAGGSRNRTQIGTERGARRGCRKVVAFVLPKLPWEIARDVHYVLGPSFMPLQGKAAIRPEDVRGSGERFDRLANGGNGDALSRSER